jgi:hypothetical protein
MPGIFKKASKISLLLLMIGVGFFSCSKQPMKDPAADDLSDLSIDPDQPAIPADASGGESGNSDTARSLDTPSAKQSDKSVDVIPPTPRIEDLEGDRPSAEDAPVEPEPPLDQSVPDSGTTSSRFGSGPQVRYIKAAELNVREKPDRYSKIVGVLKGGDKVRVQIKGGWAKLDEGRWIRSRWLVKHRPSGAFSKDSDQEGAQPVKQKAGKKRKPKTNKRKKKT